MALIQVTNLEKTYYTNGVETPVLKGLSFEIESGEFVAIMGPSGSGKSTLLHILGFLSRQTGGKYYFQGKSFEDYRESEVARVRNKKMGFVFQSFNLLPRLSVFENVKLPLLYSDIKESLWKKRVLDAIKAVGLSHRLDYIVSKLSGGEQQRVAVARAFVNEPQLIFADEPTGNLDTQSGHNIMGILERFNKQTGQTIILITHEQAIAEYASRFIEIKDGRIERDEKI